MCTVVVSPRLFFSYIAICQIAIQSEVHVEYTGTVARFMAMQRAIVVRPCREDVRSADTESEASSPLGIFLLSPSMSSFPTALSHSSLLHLRQHIDHDADGLTRS
jgi:hypothetical protein